MTDTQPPMDDDFGGDDVVAAEFALGLLDGDDALQAERRQRLDAAFADMVSEWEQRFSTLTADIAPVAPPKGLLAKITAEAYPDSPKRIWQQLGVIPAFFYAAAAALVLILAINYGALLQNTSPTPSFVAEIAAEDETIVVAAAFVQDSSTLFVEWQIGDRIDGRDVELWLISGTDAPVSLGVLNKGTKLTEFTINAELEQLLDGAVLAVSDEPLGGSDNGAPTGPILAIGDVQAI